jgi:hypothetical protein
MTESSESSPKTAALSKYVIESIVVVFGLLFLLICKPYLIPSKTDMNLLYVGIFGVLTSVVLVSIASIDSYVYKNVLLGLGIGLGMMIFQV